MTVPAPIQGDRVYCPICGQTFRRSEYLATVFDDPLALWLANMVTHYRHVHITSWNKMWGRRGSYYRQAAHFGDYEVEKQKVNERAKRQIIRKCGAYMAHHGIGLKQLHQMQSNSPETLALAAASMFAPGTLFNP